jgi:predicted dehydrogenase
MLARQWREARRLVRDGAVGNVAFARVQSSHAGPAGMAWPADPTWFYQQGAGPLLDLGAYGIDRITGILAPARRVSAIPVAELGRLRSGASSCFAGVLTVSDATDSRLTTRFDPEPEDCTPWSVVFTHLSGGALKVAVDPDSGVNCEPEFEVRMTRQG